MTTDRHEPALPRRLRAARERLGWPMETLAHHAGLSLAAIAQIESGRRTKVRPDTLIALAGALGVTVDHLLGARGDRGLLSHSALMYGSTREFVDPAASFLRAAMARDEAVLVVAHAPNIDLLTDELGGESEGVRFEESSRWYGSPLAAIEAYRAFTEEHLAAGSPWIGIVGELVWDDLQDDARTWLTYESMFNALFASWPLSVVCAYDTTALDPSLLARARRTHPLVASAAGPAPNADYLEPTDHLFAGPS